MEGGDSSGMVNPAIFQQLQAKIDEDVKIREELRDVVQELEKHGRNTQTILSRAHSTPSEKLEPILRKAGDSILAQQVPLKQLESLATQHPYYKYNQVWSREVQTLVYTLLLWIWLGGNHTPGSLLTIEEVGSFLHVPVNLKSCDAFHITIEEYLQALITLIEELTRLAVNSVTLGDFERPMQISRFVKDVHAGFQLLNLKNDALRRRSDGVKYNVKKVEDVVYDLSLRNLVPKGSHT